MKLNCDMLQRALDNVIEEYIKENDLEKVRHAHWIVDQDEGTALCSNCRIVFEDSGDTIPDYWYFCQKCGAKMDGDRND